MRHAAAPRSSRRTTVGAAASLIAILTSPFVLTAQTRPTTAPPPPPGWRTPNTHLVQRFEIRRARADEGMLAEPANESALRLTLSKVEFSHVQFAERVEYSERGVVQIEIAGLTGGSVTLQAVCYDERGDVLKYVDLIDNIEAPGRFEVPLKIYRTPLRQTKRIAFRVWLAGSDNPTATLLSVAYGMTK